MAGTQQLAPAPQREVRIAGTVDPSATRALETGISQI